MSPSISSCTSKKIKSGLCSVTAFTASKPFAHSASTSTSGCDCNNSRKTCRASSSSSTISAPILLSVPTLTMQSPAAQPAATSSPETDPSSYLRACSPASDNAHRAAVARSQDPSRCDESALPLDQTCSQPQEINVRFHILPRDAPAH